VNAVKSALLAVLIAGGAVCSAETLWQASALTQEKEFTTGIEGPAVDKDGNIYAVSFAKTPTIGKVTPAGKGELWIEFKDGSVGNGIRFNKAGTMFVADYAKHNVLKIDPATKAISVLAHDATMSQPNDIALMKSGRIYASDPNWGKNTGQIWVVEPNGAIRKVVSDMGTTNGIEVSPDEKTLYVNESVQRNVWAFDIQKDGSLTNKRLLIQFPDFGMDGMRCDVAGNLYITRHGKGTVVVLSPAGKVLREVDVLGKMPSNLCFGGPDGRTVYVTEVEHTRLVQFRADKAGREFKMVR
jgi:gluconolactonase